MLLSILLAGGGAAIGALGRFALMRLAQPLNTRWALPVTTLFINLTGSFLLGMVLTQPLSLHWQLFLGAGLMGGFTTFSTMINEIVLLYRNHHHRTAWCYLALSLLGGIACAGLGTRL